MAQPTHETRLSLLYKNPLSLVNALDAAVTAGMLVSNPTQDTVARVLHLGSRVISSCVTHKSSTLLRITAIATNTLSLLMPSSPSDLALLVDPSSVLRIILNGFGEYQDETRQSTVATILSALNIANIGFPHRA
ncbi:MAG: hypothetical protein LLF94_00390 [Chlamydiales bacterium]|nr:hypothetical protein [Chlamydiales bacterium]